MLKDSAKRALTEAVEIGSPLSGEVVRESNWRRMQMELLGYDEDTASKYADLVDWHELDRLIQRGCPLGLALEIIR